MGYMKPANVGSCLASEYLLLGVLVYLQRVFIVMTVGDGFSSGLLLSIFGGILVAPWDCFFVVITFDPGTWCGWR